MSRLIEPLESRLLFSTVAFGDGFARAVNFTDADGTRVSLSLSGGSGEVTFADDTDTAIDAVTINAGKAARLTVTATGGDGRVILEDVTVQGTLTSLIASNAVLRGALSGDLSNVQLAAVTDATITDNSASPLNLTVRGSMVNTKVIAAGRIASLRAAEWIEDGDGVSSLTAMQVGTLSITGRAGLDMNLSGFGNAVLSARVGAAEAGVWNISGNVQSLTANSTAGDWQLNVDGRLNLLNVRNLSGDTRAISAGTILAGSINDAQIVLYTQKGPQALGALVVNGNVSNTDVRTTHGIGVVSVRGVANSIFAAGVGWADSVINGGFTYAARINAFISSSFSNSAVIAYNIGTASVGTISDAPPTRLYSGVAAYSAMVIIGRQGGTLVQMIRPYDKWGDNGKSFSVRVFEEKPYYGPQPVVGEMTFQGIYDDGRFISTAGLEDDAARLAFIQKWAAEAHTLIGSTGAYQFSEQNVRARAWAPGQYFDLYDDEIDPMVDAMYTVYYQMEVGPARDEARLLQQQVRQQGINQLLAQATGIEQAPINDPSLMGDLSRPVQTDRDGWSIAPSSVDYAAKYRKVAADFAWVDLPSPAEREDAKQLAIIQKAAPKLQERLLSTRNTSLTQRPYSRVINSFLISFESSFFSAPTVRDYFTQMTTAQAAMRPSTPAAAEAEGLVETARTNILAELGSEIPLYDADIAAATTQYDALRARQGQLTPQETATMNELQARLTKERADVAKLRSLVTYYTNL